MQLEENYKAGAGGYFKGRTRTKLGLLVFTIVVLVIGYFVLELRPVDAQARGNAEFEVQAGDGFLKIVDALAAQNFIRSSAAFKAFSLVTGSALRLKPGYYLLSPSMSSLQILAELTAGPDKEVTVTIPEGASAYDIDRILSEANVIKTGSLIAGNASASVEGKLFPDTYKFFAGSKVDMVVAKFLQNFSAKTGPLLVNDKNTTSDLILASLVQKEVQTQDDMRLVAGILEKRLKAGLPLQVDSTICYIKKINSNDASCYPLTPLDFKTESPYNTYLNRGLPPTPIGNPGLMAIEAVLQPESSPYWFYLSDPLSNKTIYSTTFDEHDQNRATYLK